MVAACLCWGGVLCCWYSYGAGGFVCSTLFSFWYLGKGKMESRICFGSTIVYVIWPFFSACGYMFRALLLCW
ncbi:uncharacterized protein K452DRAFT_291895 [Aplosporella prunicola CBS 121167]|uniref:Uncharacterized protein n=1 Tax=Aplosporella prunicola CBS 121167 TaxID=1176127 RepID=A0A6A6AYW8_9PEZI|nr:uncharacterized protein K452DRAFT_291895 [Aplosporella prunicola CBS 121167]KAF2137122.1 hypothetical protein K452DRAFT_291895 [Aplosporella prunicola CBS 121167]